MDFEWNSKPSEVSKDVYDWISGVKESESVLEETHHQPDNRKIPTDLSVEDYDLSPISTPPADVPPIFTPPVDVPPFSTAPVDVPPVSTAPVVLAPFPSSPADALKPRLLIGVTGAIGAARIPHILAVVQPHVRLAIIFTPSAANFVNRHACGPVYIDQDAKNYWDLDRTELHMILGGGADCFVVVPATAHTISKAALGLTDNLLMKTLRVYKGIIHFIPDMCSEMYDDLTTARLKELGRRGHKFMKPVGGRMGSTEGVVGYIMRTVLGRHNL